MRVDAGPQLGDVQRHGEEEPLPQQRDVGLGGQEGQQDAHAVRGREEVEQEEIVSGLVARGLWGLLCSSSSRGGGGLLCGGDQQRDGGLLGLLELLLRLGDLPRVPVFQDDGFVFGEEDVEIVAAGFREQMIQPLVAVDPRKDVQRIRRLLHLGLLPPRVPRIIQVLVQMVVVRGGQAKRFHGHLPRIQLVRVAQMDQRMSQSAHEIIHQRRALLAPIEQELLNHSPPIEPLQHQLILKEIHKRALVLPPSQEIAPVVPRDLARRVLPRDQPVRRLAVVDPVQVLRVAAEDVGGPQDVRGVVVEAAVVEEDGVVDVVELEQVLEAPRRLVFGCRAGFEVVDGHRGERHGGGWGGGGGGGGRRAPE